MDGNEKFAFACACKKMVGEVHQNAVDHGWWEGEFNFAEKIALMHSELSEALEGFRHGNRPDHHIPEFNNVEVELADVVIRIFDFCGHQEIDIGKVIVEKHNYNLTRAYKHGGKKI